MKKHIDYKFHLKYLVCKGYFATFTKDNSYVNVYYSKSIKDYHTIYIPFKYLNKSIRFKG